MNRRGFIAGLGALGVFSNVPLKAGYVGDFEAALSDVKWVAIHPSVLDPDAPITSRLAKSINPTATMGFDT